MPAASKEPCVLVPVYSNRELVAACLDSVLAAGLAGARLLVVNDGSDSPLADWLRVFCREHDAQLVEHERNLGFVQAVNTGLSRAAGADVILLNSDTVVHEGWWQRLRAAAHSAADIATVTPLSNNGDICSYPVYSPDSAVDSARMDALCREVNGERLVEVPTGVGFCLYIRGDCLADVGPFDAEAFGRGYGEENDFCMRAAERGWKHVCHTGVYVEHVGGASFGEERQALMARGDRILAERYPDYGRRIDDFLDKDPLAAARDALSVARLNDPGQRESVVAEFAAERRTRRAEHRSTVQALRAEIAEFNARCNDYESRVGDYESLVDDLRTANRAQVEQYVTMEANHAALARELESVREAFSAADSQLADTRAQLGDAVQRLDALQQQLDATSRQRDDYAAEVDRLNSLWPLRLARRVKRILRL